MSAQLKQVSCSEGVVSLRESGKGVPLVLIHGVGMQSAAWGPQIEDLSSDCRVIALDLPGHGGSDSIAMGSALPDYVNWLAAVFDALKLNRANIAGHSMGALIALGFAATHPARTERVALLNGVYRRTAEASAAVKSRAAEIRAGQFDVSTPLNRWFGTTSAQTKIRAQVAEWLHSVDPAGYGTAYTAFAHGDATYAKKLQDIACPFLAITGDGDPNSTPDMSKAMARAVQQGRAVTIEGHRHMVNLTAPVAVNKQLRIWLSIPAERETAR